MAANWDKFKEFFELRNVENYATHLIPYIKPNSKIIDVGCGIGTITRDFARRAPQGSVVGIDSSEQSIITARSEAEKEGLTNVEFVVGDAENLEYSDDSFDIAHAHQVMIHLTHPVQSLRHMYRIIKPGGVVGIRDLSIFFQIGPTTLLKDNLDKFWQSTRARGAEGQGAGLRNHIWMHEAGFDWEKIKSGSVAFDYEKKDLPTVSEGQITFAKLRGESDDYIERLRNELEAWVVSPEARGVAMDGWVVGEK